MTIVHSRIAACMLVAGLGCTACTLPLESSELESTDEAVRIWGYTAGPMRPITVECNATHLQPVPAEFVAFATVYSTNESLSQAGETAYAFDEEVVIPGWCWDLSVGLGRFTTFLRTRDAATGTVHEHFTLSGYQCLTEEYFGGAGPRSAWDTCRSQPGASNGWRWAIVPL